MGLTRVMSALFSTVGKQSRMKAGDMEDLSAKVTIDLLEAENRRLKKVEETTGRLRKYNGELRHALIKAQGQDPLIKIPDDGEDSKLFSNEPVEDNSQNLQSFAAVVFNEIIMEKVFKKLDVKTIKTCRLICKNWNEKASRILSRHNGGYGLAVRLETEKLNGMTDGFQRHTIQGLRSTIASGHKHWFSKALLDKDFTRKTEIQSVLLDFGYLLRSIEITGWNFLFQDIHKILVDWCPNLEQLALPPCLIVRDGQNFPGGNELKKGYRKLVFTQPLKLTGLFMQEQLCISIVKASPNLKTLSLYSDFDRYSFAFFKELMNCPKITRNLENLRVVTGAKDPTARINQTIKVLNRIQFSSKLKKLAFEATGQFRAKELSEVLEKLGGCLEKLVLGINNGMDPEMVFPEMNNLTELKYFSIATMPINSIEFLTGMPNLKTLYLGENDFGIMEEEYFIDNWFSDCEKLRRNPRTKLKELYLFGVVQSPTHTFEMMNNIFPNLTELVVGIFVLPYCNDWQELKNYYTGMLDGGISKMCNLKYLCLDFRRPEPVYQEEFDYMAFVFSQIDKLKKLSNLNCLTIRDNSKSTTALVGDKLLEIPNLREVTLIGVKLERLEAKGLIILLYQHDILLEIEDAEFEEDFRACFEEQLVFRRRILV